MAKAHLHHAYALLERSQLVLEHLLRYHPSVDASIELFLEITATKDLVTDVWNNLI